MDIIRDIVFVNKKTAAKTYKSIKKNWLLVFTGIIYSMLNIIIYYFLSLLFVGPFARLAGFLSVIVSSAFISNYLYLLYNVINYNRMTFRNFKDGFGYFLAKIYSVFFIGFIFNMLLSLISTTLGSISYLIGGIIQAIILIVLNPLPETIYLRSYDGMGSIRYTTDFMKKNWLNWLLPNTIFFIGIYLLTGELFGQIFQTHIVFRLESIFLPNLLIKNLLGQVLFTIGMVYRGHLYKLLSSGSRRKRKFMSQY